MTDYLLFTDALKGIGRAVPMLWRTTVGLS